MCRLPCVTKMNTHKHTHTGARLGRPAKPFFGDALTCQRQHPDGAKAGSDAAKAVDGHGGESEAPQNKIAEGDVVVVDHLPLALARYNGNRYAVVHAYGFTL